MNPWQPLDYNSELMALHNFDATFFEATLLQLQISNKSIFSFNCKLLFGPRGYPSIQMVFMISFQHLLGKPQSMGSARNAILLETKIKIYIVLTLNILVIDHSD